MKQVKGDVKVCMTCGSTEDLERANSWHLILYECAKCRGVKPKILQKFERFQLNRNNDNNNLHPSSEM